jgi:hypothetical protein
LSNIRSFLNWRGEYDLINREERNLAAVFYHVLLMGDNMARFLKSIEYGSPVVPGESGVYFEYAYLRDLWATQATRNEQKRELILSFLKPSNAETLSRMSIYDFNSYFGAVQHSGMYIQSPGNWSIGRYKANITDDTAFLKTCRFKWAFNAKPDIVIHTSHDKAICIECKFESGEGSYPSNNTEIAEFDRRGLQRVGQTDLQKYMMEDLLGVDTTYLFLVQKPNSHSSSHATILWKDAFSAMSTEGCPSFIKAWVRRVSEAG